MQCTVSPTPSATPARTPWAVSPRSLAAAFAHIPDPRRARSVTYALPALLALAVAAILSNHLSVLAIAEWGARQSPDLLRTLGFADGRTPCQATLQRLFSKRDGHARAAALCAHFAAPVRPLAEGEGAQGRETVRKGWPSMARRSGGACPSRTGAARCRR